MMAASGECFSTGALRTNTEFRVLDLPERVDGEWRSTEHLIPLGVDISETCQGRVDCLWGADATRDSAKWIDV